MLATEEDRRAILDAIGTYRMGAPILIDDVRIACAVDGHPIDHVPASTLPHIIRERCDAYVERDAKHHRLYIRRW